MNLLYKTNRLTDIEKLMATKGGWGSGQQLGPHRDDRPCPQAYGHAQCPVVSHSGGGHDKEHTQVRLNHFTVHQKLTQHCKPTVFHKNRTQNKMEVGAQACILSVLLFADPGYRPVTATQGGQGLAVQAGQRGTRQHAGPATTENAVCKTSLTF